MTPRSRGTSEIIGRSRREVVTMSEKHGRIGLEGKRGEEEKNCIEELCVCVRWWWKGGVQKVGRKARSSLSASVGMFR